MIQVRIQEWSRVQKRSFVALQVTKKETINQIILWLTSNRRDFKSIIQCYSQYVYFIFVVRHTNGNTAVIDLNQKA